MREAVRLLGPVGQLTVFCCVLTIRESHRNVLAWATRRRRRAASRPLPASAHGRSQASTIELSDPQAAVAPREEAQAALVLPQVQHGRAAARRVSQLRLLHGAGDCGERSGIAGRFQFKVQCSEFKVSSIATLNLEL
jgi:hypothetical protein